MKAQLERHKFIGLQSDFSYQSQKGEYLIEANNIRITARGDSNTFSITNEKGSKKLFEGVGKYLGHCVLNKYIIIFSTEEATGYDHIIKFNTENSVITDLVDVNINLGFNINNPIQAIPYYENENIQKVYWTDGLNQPRFINIVGNKIIKSINDINFLPELKFEEDIKIFKQFNGSFHSGVIQYAFTYYNTFGYESNIFYTSPLLYISNFERGGRPDEIISNSFEITIDNPDTNFEFIRVYSIHRTSLNAAPVCKIVTDLKLNDIASKPYKVTCIDNGIIGSTIEANELLFKNRDVFTAKTLASKDNTLFFGNLTLLRNNLKSLISTIQEKTTIRRGIPRTIKFLSQSKNTVYKYSNQLSGVNDTTGESTPCGTFKHFDFYRLGIQFQYKTGTWSEPIFIKDYQIDNSFSYPYYRDGSGFIDQLPRLDLPIIEGIINDVTVVNNLYDLGYRRARGVVVFPTINDRVSLCQGIIDPTVTTVNNKNNRKEYQSSWIFRPKFVSNPASPDNLIDIDGSAIGSNINTGKLQYTDKALNYNPKYIKSVEIQGCFNDDNQFYSTKDIINFYSPDLQFDNSCINFNFINTKYRYSGYIKYTHTLSDIDIQTSTTTVSPKASGFYHHTFVTNSCRGIISGLFYEDYLVDDDYRGNAGEFGPYDDHEFSPCKWMVYMWNKNGSLNNDMQRAANTSIQSSLLLKKIISNLRYTETVYDKNDTVDYLFKNTPKVFNGDTISIEKLDNKFYFGNIDTLLFPDEEDGNYIAFNNNPTVGLPLEKGNVITPFTSLINYKTFREFDVDGLTVDHGLYWFNGTTWGNIDNNLGDVDGNIVSKKDGVRMRYKSDIHICFDSDLLPSNIPTEDVSYSDIIDIILPGDTVGSDYRTTMFGGTSEDALMANSWIPCGKPVNIVSGNSLTVQYTYGDTYYQRWDCLKTYPYTKEDINQVVEIGSFMLESRINIDGRYDNQRGQINNLYVSKENFNLLNMVYTQQDNFFNYKILDERLFNNNIFKNQITWSLEKHPVSDIDIWTNITLSSIYNINGDKGEINSINLCRDKLFCFQNKGIGVILFNSRVQIPTSDNIPIEITNSYKVDGITYIADSIGCNSFRQIVVTPNGIYFIDNNTGHLTSIGEGMKDISVITCNTSWFESNYPDRILYDNYNSDIYVSNFNNTSYLGYNELLGQFVSLYDYKNIACIESIDGFVYSIQDGDDFIMHNLFRGSYNYLFDEYKPWKITFITNGLVNKEDTFCKIFSNVIYKLDFNKLLLSSPDSYIPHMTFNYVESSTEYQNSGIVPIKQIKNKPAIVKKKFREWALNIPRDSVHKFDRMRDIWCKIKLGMYNYDDILPFTGLYPSDVYHVGETVIKEGVPYILKEEDIFYVDAKAELNDLTVIYYI